MTNEAKSSPAFHEVKPEIVPLHSFCQIFFPIRVASPWDNVMADREGMATKMQENVAKTKR